MLIEIKNLTHIYAIKTPFEKNALSEINLNINEGDYIAIAGHTGSGKSTLIQIIAGLIKPTAGHVFIDNIDLNSKNKSAKLNVRRRIGIVFQYPEMQLFEETVEKDIAFGPKNLNLNEDEIDRRVNESMKLVGLSETLKKISPFNLSGGQKRRVAIAGVLAMQPKYLILDEPTAGLDPRARDELMNKINNLYNKENLTIILISHNMDDIARFANRIVILNQGKVLADDTPRKIFNETDILQKAGLIAPSTIQLLSTIRSRGLNIDMDAITVDECENKICNFVERHKKI